jgi:hypothetical protein
MEDKVIKGFKKDFLVIKEKGWVPSNRLHDTGIGKTFEDLMGIVENNNFLADYQDVLELKSSRELAQAMVTLFTDAPTFPKKVNSILREKYGQKDSESGVKIIHSTFSTIKFNTFIQKYGFKLDVDEANKKIFIRIKDLQTNELDEMEIHYTFDDLKEIIEKKCKYIAYIKAQSKKENDKESFKFVQASLLSGLTFEKFIECVKNGLIVYDIRLGVYRSGKNKGKPHDHGSGFRVLKNNLNKVFDVEEL